MQDFYSDRVAVVNPIRIDRIAPRDDTLIGKLLEKRTMYLNLDTGRFISQSTAQDKDYCDATYRMCGSNQAQFSRIKTRIIGEDLSSKTQNFVLSKATNRLSRTG